jgi:hypothetical protein
MPDVYLKVHTLSTFTLTTKISFTVPLCYFRDETPQYPLHMKMEVAMIHYFILVLYNDALKTAKMILNDVFQRMYK